MWAKTQCSRMTQIACGLWWVVFEIKPVCVLSLLTLLVLKGDCGVICHCRVGKQTDSLVSASLPLLCFHNGIKKNV